MSAFPPATAVESHQSPGPTAGPYTHRVLSASSPDGLVWTRDPGVRVDHASVPCAVADGDRRILLYYVDADRGPGRPESVGCAVSEDGLRFEKQPFVLEGPPTAKALDPSILKDEAGLFRLYYFASSASGDPAADPKPHEVHLALSEDGIRFKESGLVFARPGLVDPDVFLFKGMWFMYVFGGGATIIATSGDGQSFSYRQDLDLPGWGTTAPIQPGDGRLRLYAFEQRVPSANSVRSFLSSDGFRWTAEEGVRLRAGEGEQITDPFVIRWKGGYKMYYKSQGSPTQGPPAGAQPSPPAGQDIRTHRVHFGTSQDGLTWRLGESPIRQAASVPDLLELTRDSPAGRRGTLIVTFVDASSVKGPGTEGLSRIVSTDGGKTWSEARPLKVLGKPNRGAAVDPSLIQLPDGRLRLYFFGSEVTQGDPASDTAPHRFYSAVSSDGLTFEVEPGIRFEAPQVTDPEVVAVRSEYFMYISRGPETLKAVSSDGLTFRAVPDFLLRDGGVPGAVALPDGSVRVFVSGRGGVLSVVDRPGQAPVREEGVRVPGGGEIVADPDVVRREDGSFAGVFKRAPGGVPPTQGPSPGGGGVQPPTAPGGLSADFDGDGEVGFNDFFAFAAAFGQKASGDSARFDLDRSGEVDFGDFFIFADSFGKKVSALPTGAPPPPSGGAQGPGG